MEVNTFLESKCMGNREEAVEIAEKLNTGE